MEEFTDIVAAYGTDTLRLYEMAMGPLDTSRPWNTSDIVGMHRFHRHMSGVPLDLAHQVSH